MLHLARQPILDRENEIIGYEFFYRNTEQTGEFDDPRQATASVLVSLLNQIGTAQAFGKSAAFINTDAPLLLTDILRPLPAEQFVFELASTTRITPRIIDAVRHFHSLGFRFALDNASFTPEYFENFGPIFPFVEFAKFDVNQVDIEAFHIFPNPYGKMKLIAQKVEFPEMAEAYRELGFHAFQGFYFAHPHLLSSPRIDPRYSDVMAIFSLLQTNAPIEKIVQILEKESSLSLQMLQFLKSSSVQPACEELSIRCLLEQFDSYELMQWLMLIIYSKSGTKSMDEKNPYSVFVQNRIDTMLFLLSTIVPEPTQVQIEHVRTIGIVSLIEGVLNTPLSTLIESFPLSSDVEKALTMRKGLLGDIYHATLKLENGDEEGASAILKTYGIG